MNVQEDFQEEITKKTPSTSSLEMPVIEDIPEEYWLGFLTEFRHSIYLNEMWMNELDETDSSLWSRESERLQRITDYSEPRLETQLNRSLVIRSQQSVLGWSISVTSGSQQGAGDGGDVRVEEVHEGEMKETSRRSHKRTEKSKLFSKARWPDFPLFCLVCWADPEVPSPPLEGDSRSRVSIISDCRLRNLRLDTQYDITSEKIDTPPGEVVKRK
ncbi:unnamed protein product [Danaus chrysippus]|uniref:(African queen) hypothetical protein n=1 Tax=Danaus chrysippus TaxID=151541 RepID=A0A8J2QLG8_9NEOP|nr:unnamed protein product [Danaus chrysippus]